jgi:hypothetical protein
MMSRDMAMVPVCSSNPSQSLRACQWVCGNPAQPRGCPDPEPFAARSRQSSVPPVRSTNPPCRRPPECPGWPSPSGAPPRPVGCHSCPPWWAYRLRFCSRSPAVPIALGEPHRGQPVGVAVHHQQAVVDHLRQRG